MIKPDGTPATDDELENKQAEEEASAAATATAVKVTEILTNMKSGSDIKPPKQQAAPAQAQPAPPPPPPTKVDDQPKASITVKAKKKDPPIKPIQEAEVTKSTQEILKVEEPTIVIDEVLLSRPPTPPKPKVFLPPIDVSPFVK